MSQITRDNKRAALYRDKTNGQQRKASDLTYSGTSNFILTKAEIRPTEIGPNVYFSGESNSKHTTTSPQPCVTRADRGDVTDPLSLCDPVARSSPKLPSLEDTQWDAAERGEITQAHTVLCSNMDRPTACDRPDRENVGTFESSPRNRIESSQRFDKDRDKCMRVGLLDSPCLLATGQCGDKGSNLLPIRE
jgi:hypothetical protein